MSFQLRPARRRGVGANRRSPIADRFWGKIERRPGSSCWHWIGHVNPNGYGWFSEGGKPILAHRWAYQHFIGPIPDGHHIDHLCRTRDCAKPDHLEAVTQGENNRRAWVVRKLRREVSA